MARVIQVIQGLVNELFWWGLPVLGYLDYRFFFFSGEHS